MRAYWRDFVKFIPLLIGLTGRDFKLKYRRSFLGILWSMLNPLLTMLVLTSVFSIILRQQPIGMPFTVYYITGATLFNFFSEASSSSMSSVIGNASLIKKVYIPKYIFVLEKCSFSFINMLFSLIAMMGVILFYVITGEVQLHLTVFFIFIPVMFVFVFSVGIGLILSAVSVFFRDITHIWGVLITLWTYFTPLIYSIDLLRDHGLEWVVKLNPLFYFVDDFRSLMIRGVFPSVNHFLISFCICSATLLFGTLIFRKVQDRFILHI